MKIEVDNDFDGFDYDEKSFVLKITPDVHFDERGSFSESWKLLDKNPGGSEKSDSKDEQFNRNWIFEGNWFKQINTSKSSRIVLRGCHAQSGVHCQAKLVTSISGNIYDIITDARPNSRTFLKSKVYFLNPKRQNKVFVPRGFLHAFVTSIENMEYVFQYMCDNTYNRDSEVKVNPIKLAVPAFKEYCETYGLYDFLGTAVSDRTASIQKSDVDGRDPSEFFGKVAKLWDSNGTVWYA